MKSITTYILAASVALVASVQAQCECDPADSACLGECVGNTNQCISECHSNECYSRCIAYHWPGADPNSASNRWEQPTSTWQGESSTAWAQPTSSQWNNNGQSSQWPTSSVWVPSGAPTMSQSTPWSQSVWPSASTWAPGYSYSGMVPSASASASASGASSMSASHMSKAVVGVALAAAAYFLQ